MKAYGKQRLVCYKHRSMAGGAVCSFGQCENCQTEVNEAVGSPPKLCNECSKRLSECAVCRVKLN